MSTLPDIDPNAVELPGLRTRTRHTDREGYSLIVENDHGAVELWQSTSIPQMHPVLSTPNGGVEVHSRTQIHNSDPEPASEHCHVLDGRCWDDGSSLAYSEQFHPLIQAGDSAGVLRRLASWHENHIGNGDSQKGNR